MAYSNINKPTDYFNTVLWSGDNTTNRAITGVNFQPDLVWIKARTEVHQHNWFDVIRGVNKNLVSNSTNAEATDTLYGYLASYDTDGFTTQKGSSASQWNVNETGENYVAWNWLAGGTAVSNTQGSITSSVSANTTSGFSVVSYTGNGSGGSTVGHGLSQKPACIIVKKRSGAMNWGVYHQSLASNEILQLDVTNAVYVDSGVFNATQPTASVFYLGGGTGIDNASSDTYIAYCFAEKKGFSKFGKYTGNGSTDGTFVYTGFKPAFIMAKKTDTTSSWAIYDNKRTPYNVMDTRLLANTSGVDDVSADNNIDFVSNGIKFRASTGWNASATYVYMAFAENPLVASNYVSTTAR